MGIFQNKSNLIFRGNLTKKLFLHFEDVFS